MLISFEGIDACGKATQSKLLAKKLNAAHMAFPNYDTPTGRLIKLYLQEHMWTTPAMCGPTVLQALMTTNRLECLGLINSLRNQMRDIVFDRFDASALVYGAEDGCDADWLRLIQIPVHVDHRILLDVSVEESFIRRPERRDRNERNGAYLERIRQRYLDLFNVERKRKYKGEHARLLPWHTIDGHGTVEEVHQKVCDVIGLK